MRLAVEAARSQALPQVVEAVGTVKSRAQSVLSSRIVAAVVAVHAREGDRVRAGQLLVTLDDRDVRAQLDRARAGLREARSALEEVERAIDAAERAIEAALAQAELARTTLGRSRLLVERGLIARQDHDEAAARARVTAAEAARAREVRASLEARRSQARARIEAAEAEAENAVVAAGYARLTAAAGGIVAGRSVEVGNLAAPGVPLLTLEDERYRLEATVRESDVGRLGVGQRAAVSLDAVGRELAGAIVEVVPAGDPASRTFTVKVDLPALAGLRSGLYGRARFAVGQRAALTVPGKAVTERGQLEAVFVVGEDDLARLRLVRTGQVHGDRIEVLSGLGEGERVVLDPAKAAEGLPVDGRP